MAIVKMKRLRLITLEEERPRLLSRLQHLGCVEISEPDEKLADPQWSALLRRGTSASSEIKTQIAQCNHALAALQKYAPAKSGLFLKRPDMSEAAFLDAEAHTASLHIVQTIDRALANMNQLSTQENRLSSLRLGLLPWVALQIPLNSISTEHVQITLGVCPSAVSLDAAAEALSDAAPLSQLIPISQDKDQHYLLLLVHNSEAAEAAEALKPCAFSAGTLKDLSGTPSEEIAKIEGKLLEVTTARQKEEELIASFGGCRPEIRHLLDKLNQDFQRESARERTLTDGTMVFLEIGRAHV